MSLCFIFTSTSSVNASCHICLSLHLLLTSHCHGICFCILPSMQPHHIYMVLVPTLHMHHCCFCITKFSCFPLVFFFIFFNVLICSWNQCLVVSLIIWFDLCKFLYSFVLVLQVSNFLGFYLFNVLCRCNFFGFYNTFIVSMIFFFSFLSFFVYFILFIIWKRFIVGVLQILFLKFWRILYL